MVIVFDLDDTLYDELEFIKSGFKEISKFLQNESYYDYMMEVFLQEGSGKVFNRLIEKYNIDVPLSKLIEIYRFHIPDIVLAEDSLELLDFAKKFNTALISDGHYIMQKNKFDALKLGQYIRYPIFTDFYHTKKPEVKPYKMVMDHFKNEKFFIYISDNPKKDFMVLQALGWIGIRYKNPVGIYRNFENNTNYEVSDKQEIINILKVLNNA